MARPEAAAHGLGAGACWRMPLQPGAAVACTHCDAAARQPPPVAAVAAAASVASSSSSLESSTTPSSVSCSATLPAGTAGAAAAAEEGPAGGSPAAAPAASAAAAAAGAAAWAAGRLPLSSKPSGCCSSSQSSCRRQEGTVNRGLNYAARQAVPCMPGRSWGRHATPALPRVGGSGGQHTGGRPLLTRCDMISCALKCCSWSPTSRMLPLASPPPGSWDSSLGSSPR